MKKRRVLALLLALSLAVSTNGMTVLATEAGELAAPAVSTVEESTDNVQDETDTADDEENIESEGTEKGVEVGDDSTTDETGKDEEGTIGGEASDEKEETNPDEQIPDAADTVDETLSGNDLADEEEPVAEETEELPEVIKNEVRLMTFTDDTGLKITYDANAAANYKYTVENGVLIKVEEAKSTGEGGNPVWTDVAFTGDVVLTQPEEGEKYTSVAAGLFRGNRNITYVKLPDGVTGIADNAFSGCTALKGAYLPATVTLIGASAFEGCTAMTQIAVPKAVTSIGDNAFKDDAKLYMVYMKDVDYSALASVGDHAFEGCSALAEFCSDTEFFLPASLTGIGEAAFKGCTSIGKVDLNTAKLVTMGASTFEGCTGLKEAGMSGTFGTIPNSAFKGCNKLEILTFSSRNDVTIGVSAFQECYSLKKVEFPESLKEISDYAFAGCRKLSCVVFNNSRITFGTDSFPTGSNLDGRLVFVGKKFYNKSTQERTELYSYYMGLDAQNIAFVDPSEDNSKEYYTYKVADSAGIIYPDGVLDGGKIWVGTADKPFDDINTYNSKQGVPSDDNTKYYIYHEANANYSLVEGSIKSNGETVQKDKIGYWITMPYGGTVITAEFRRNGSTDRVEASSDSDITVEFSNGEAIQPEGVELKIGQTTRMFLLDKNGLPISSSQIQKIVSDKTSVAKVSSTGVITAVGKGTAKITVTLMSRAGNNNTILVRRTISVVEAEIDSIRIGASNYVSDIRITANEDGVQTASVVKSQARDGLSITLKAYAYTAEKEGIAKELTWKSSDTNIAKLQKSSTTSADSSNVVTIQPGCEGEATITVSAKVNSKKTVTQKFVISVQNRSLKLASSSITVNPNLVKCGELEVISSYGADLPLDVPTIIEKEQGTWVSNSDFRLEEKEKSQSNGNNGSRRYNIVLSNSDAIKDGKYNVYVCFNDAARDSSLPLTITVKRSVPAPTVKFNTKKTKFNLFYKNGGTDADGNQITVTTEVTKLGNVKLCDAKLCALTDDKEDDQLFLDNFEIVNNSEDLAKGIITIKRKAGNLKYTPTKKLAVTGYLQLSYEGYRTDIVKKVKVTMPTVTTAPAYVLDRTSETYRTTAPTQHEALKLLDKKTKQQITFNENVKLSRCETDDSVVQKAKLENSEITFDVVSGPTKDKAKFILINPTEWDKDKDGKDRELSYTFNVKVTSSEPTIKTDQTVTLNLNYPEVEGTFALKSNQKDTELTDDQTFTPNSTARNTLEYDKLKVSYENGVGTVKIDSSKGKPKAGTYKWSCKPYETQGSARVQLTKTTTLTVKVVDTKPVVKLGKGSLVLNRAAYIETGSDRIYKETAEIPLKITGKPEGYMLDDNIITTIGETAEVGTKIECTTRNESGAANQFVWKLVDVKTVDGKLVDGKLSVSIKNGGVIPSKKTYAFKMTARYVQQGQGDDSTPNVVEAKPMTFNVKVDDNTDISVTFSTKGKLNLVDREGEYTTKNTLIYTPTLKNVRGKIEAAYIYDDDNFDEPSKYFDIYLNEEDGKLYVTPKKTPVNSGTGEGGETGGTGDNTGGDNTGGDNTGGDNTETGGENGSVSGNTIGGESGTEGTGGTEGGSGETGGNTGIGETNEPENHAIVPQSEVIQDYQYAELENNKQYRVKIEVKVEGYNGNRGRHNGIVSKPITIKTAQVLPKVTTDKSTIDVYLSNKQYDATFTVTPQEGAAGIVEEIKFHDDDEVPRDAFEIIYEKQKDGSLKVIVHLKEAVAYKCDSTNKVKMYIKFKGQGTNTTGTLVNMNIKVNK